MTKDMTKAKYMALDDLQTVWSEKIKPAIEQTYATKQDTGTASVATCQSIIDELT